MKKAETTADNRTMGVWRFYKMVFDGVSEDAPSTSLDDEQFGAVIDALESILPTEQRLRIVLEHFGLSGDRPKAFSEICPARPDVAARIVRGALTSSRLNAEAFPSLFGFAAPEPLELPVSGDVEIGRIHTTCRAYNCMRRVGIDTVADILAFPKEDWPHVRNLGRKTLEEIVNRMHEIGYPDFEVPVPTLSHKNPG